jgi:hypothetical protein
VQGMFISFAMEKITPVLFDCPRRPRFDVTELNSAKVSPSSDPRPCAELLLADFGRNSWHSEGTRQWVGRAIHSASPGSCVPFHELSHGVGAPVCRSVAR